MFRFRRHVVESGMPINLVLGRIEQSAFVLRVTGIQIGRSYHPYADSFIPARVNIAGVFNCHFGIGSMEATDMFVRQSILAPDEDFPKRPLSHGEGE